MKSCVQRTSLARLRVPAWRVVASEVKWRSAVGSPRRSTPRERHRRIQMSPLVNTFTTGVSALVATLEAQAWSGKATRPVPTGTTAAAASGVSTPISIASMTADTPAKPEPRLALRWPGMRA